MTTTDEWPPFPSPLICLSKCSARLISRAHIPPNLGLSFNYLHIAKQVLPFRLGLWDAKPLAESMHHYHFTSEGSL